MSTHTAGAARAAAVTPRGAPSAADIRHPHYQTIKAKVHQELLNRLNLERRARVSRDQAEPEIRTLILGLLETETKTTPLSLYEREAMTVDVLDALFGLGPLEALLKDPTISDILVNRYNNVYVEREGRIEECTAVFRDDKHLMQIIERIVSRSAGASTNEPMVAPSGRRSASNEHPADALEGRASRSAVSAPIASAAATWSIANR